MSAIDPLVNNLHIGIENLLLLMTALGCIIIGAKDLRIAIMVSIVLFMSEFIVFYQLGLQWEFAALAFLMTIVFLSLALLITYKKQSTIGVI